MFLGGIAYLSVVRIELTRTTWRVRGVRVGRVHGALGDLVRAEVFVDKDYVPPANPRTLMPWPAGFVLYVRGGAPVQVMADGPGGNLRNVADASNAWLELTRRPPSSGTPAPSRSP